MDLNIRKSMRLPGYLNITTMKQALILASALLAVTPANAQFDKAGITALIDSFHHALPETKGIIVHVEAPGQKLSWSYATGASDTVSGHKLSAAQPVLTASNTKTYVAAAILRLQEMKKLTIEQSVDELLPSGSRELLRSDGYDLKAIRVKHLLSHSSGIDDYVNDAYFEEVDANRRKRWTREEQIKLAATVGKPLGAPGDTFKYADVNYLLLTEIIESKTGKAFPAAIRELLQYDRIGLAQTWFTTLEPEPEKHAPPAHQYWMKKHWDAQDFDPSWDLYGGGGIVATAGDMARFFQALFDRRIIKDSATLALMHRPVMQGDPHNYCLGIRVLSIGGYPAWYHGGFWGTDAAYFPDLDASIATIVLEKEQRGIAGIICSRIAADLRKNQTNRH
jgi:D-alanyl-D-alanine carboxypeptidase